MMTRKIQGTIVIILFLLISLSQVKGQSNLLPPKNFQKYYSCTTIDMQWEQPISDSSSIIAYNIYIEDSLYATTNETSMQLEMDMGDSLTLRLTTAYINGESPPITSIVEIPYYESHTDFNGYLYPDNDCCYHLYWTPPDSWTSGNELECSRFHQYCTESTEVVQVYADDADLAIRFDQTFTASYDDIYIEQIAFIPANNEQSYKVKVWEGDSASTLVWEQEVAFYTINEWNYISLDTLIKVDTSKELWVGYQMTSDSIYPMKFITDQGEAVESYGNWIKIMGEWQTMSQSISVNNKIKLVFHKNPQADIPFFNINVYFWGYPYNSYYYYSDTTLDGCIIGVDNISSELITLQLGTVFNDCELNYESISFESNCEPHNLNETDLPTINIREINGQIIISSDELIQKCHLFSPMGKLIKTIEPNSEETSLNASSLNQGLYILLIETANYQTVEKIMHFPN